MAVLCLSAEQQVVFHQGYGPAQRDWQGMAWLRTTFGGPIGFDGLPEGESQPEAGVRLALGQEPPRTLLIWVGSSAVL
ncbi:nucleotidyltransferase domain-containing protein [Streptomyces zhihengii]